MSATAPFLCAILLSLLSVLPVAAQGSTSTQHFAKQLLNLENELEEFRDKIDQKERQIRASLSQKTNQLYALREKQRSASDLSKEERKKLVGQITNLSASIKKDKLRMNEVMGIMERKRKDIFTLKLSIDEWVAKVEATEISVINRIERMKNEITSLIEQLDKEFRTTAKKK